MGEDQPILLPSSVTAAPSLVVTTSTRILNVCALPKMPPSKLKLGLNVTFLVAESRLRNLTTFWFVSTRTANLDPLGMLGAVQEISALVAAPKNPPVVLHVSGAGTELSVPARIGLVVATAIPLKAACVLSTFGSVSVANDVVENIRARQTLQVNDLFALSVCLETLELRARFPVLCFSSPVPLVELKSRLPNARYSKYAQSSPPTKNAHGWLNQLIT